VRRYNDRYSPDNPLTGKVLTAALAYLPHSTIDEELSGNSNARIAIRVKFLYAENAFAPYNLPI